MRIKVQDLLEKIDYIEYSGPKNKIIDKIVPLNEINGISQAICWCSDKNSMLLNEIKTSSIIIVSSNVHKNLLKSINYIIVEKPRLIFQQILTNHFAPSRLSKIHISSSISSNCIIGKNAFIGHNVVIEKGCVIGDDVVILHNSVILERTIIGNNVTIGSNNTIGGIGFGYEKNMEGDFELIPHIGNVIIKNNVDIGNNTCIDRGVLESTFIDENVKIDNLVHIAHGVHLSRNSVVIANAMIAGSVNIGENTWIAPSASVINKKNVGSNSLVGMGAVVTKSVENNTIVAGNPARFIRSIK
jgi:UDP-3-O-[3-hydroxymyristoyl] glucosamine N-acyltransferase